MRTEGESEKSQIKINKRKRGERERERKKLETLQNPDGWFNKSRICGKTSTNKRKNEAAKPFGKL